MTDEVDRLIGTEQNMQYQTPVLVHTTYWSDKVGFKLKTESLKKGHEVQLSGCMPKSSE